LFSDRQESDYGYDATLSADDVRADLSDATEFVARCRSLLEEAPPPGGGER
jgi:uncharacterized protein (UPF0332 family)